ncbi:MAG: ABC transporter substrate-binding protein [Treponema sp.]|jgi:multiple sugar transport system substrate-binding protein|nr:ABC transporter substrate-binding protein [Treponema sp.]
MKKKEAVLFMWALGVYLTVSTFVFAGGSRDTAELSKKTVDLRCLSFFSGSDRKCFDAMIAEFNRVHPGVRIIAETLSYDGYNAALRSAIAAGTAPDVAVIHQCSLPGYVKDGSLCVLEDPAQDTAVPLKAPDDFMDVPLEACRFDGRLYALPLDMHPLVMYYNTDLFSRAEVVKVPETYAELIKTAWAIQNKTGAAGIAADNTTSVFKAWTPARLFISLLQQQGADILTADNTRTGFKNIAGEKALSVILDLNEVSRVIPPGLTYEASVDAFRLGKAGIHINGVWAAGIFEGQKNLNFAAAPLPSLTGRNAVWAGSHTLAIPARQSPDPRKTEAAAAFILWMTEHGELWAKAGHVPVRESVVRKPEFLSLPYRSVYLDAARSAVIPPRTPAWDEIFDSIADCLENAMTANKSIKAILTEMDRKVTEIIAAH